MLIKKILFLIVSSLFMLTVAYADSSVFYDTKGNAVELSRLKGKWVVVNYWAGWCGACLQEIPELNRFYQRIKNTNIVFYGVDYDELPIADLQATIQSVGIQYPVLTNDPGPVWGFENSDVIPTTYIIDPQGHVVKMITGTTTENSLLETIAALQK